MAVKIITVEKNDGTKDQYLARNDSNEKYSLNDVKVERNPTTGQTTVTTTRNDGQVTQRIYGANEVRSITKEP